jgi:hypothetical protein
MRIKREKANKLTMLIFINISQKGLFFVEFSPYAMIHATLFIYDVLNTLLTRICVYLSASLFLKTCVKRKREKKTLLRLEGTIIIIIITQFFFMRATINDYKRRNILNLNFINVSFYTIRIFLVFFITVYSTYAS